MHAYVSHLRLDSGMLDPLLRSVADYYIGDVVFAPATFDWLYRPYDGGVDVFLPSAEEWDQLSRTHADWLSPYASGL